jgi:uncharacterized membrane protein YbhN (UPF0104 family)
MKKHTSNIIIAFSLIFLTYYLWSKSLLDFTLINWNAELLISLGFLFLGFIISGLSWWWALKLHQITISPKEGIVSHGLPIFAKYIPGKIWTILGRASQVAKSKNLSSTSLSFISLKEQLVYLIVGILISIIPIYLTYGLGEFFFIVLASGLGIYLIIFNKQIHKLILWLGKKILKKNLDLPLINVFNGLKLSLFNVLLWLSWTFAFYFFLLSFDSSLNLKLAFIFPVSVVYGVLAIIMPGGIGVREGIITTFFVTIGMELELATSISVVSRLWFIIGEAFIFVLSSILKLSNK